MKRVRILEKNVERDVTRLLELHGFTVYRLSQGYRAEPGGTRMTPGVPDLYAVHNVKGALWVEVKTPAGLASLDRLVGKLPTKSQVRDWRRAMAQHGFGALMRTIGHPYARGGVAEVQAELQRIGVRSLRAA